MDKICKTCKWWFRFWEDEGHCHNDNIGKTKGRLDNGVRIEVMSGASVLMLGENFGCIHWEGKNNDANS